ncbi:MAG: GNAT family N-acetyltransferase [Acidobacteriota bacterium]
MSLSADQQNFAASAQEWDGAVEEPLTIHPLAGEHEAEALAFLAARPVHTVFMSGCIRDNGVVSELNRGTFYGCRNLEGRLEGVALIGHATLVETRSDAALAAFARFARGCPLAYMILGEQEKVELFWNHFARDEHKPHRVCREILFEQKFPLEGYEKVRGLCLATADDLPALLPVYGAMIAEESGVNPLDVDPDGYRERWLRRIEQDRVWVWMEDGRLIFNADIISDTPECIYLEGVYVSPEERGKGYGLRGLSQLGGILLERTRSLCLFVNEQNHRAQAFYHRAGYARAGQYDTIFLGWKS